MRIGTFWKYSAVVVLVVLAMGWWGAGAVQRVQARWILRDSTAVNPVSLCKDAAYIGVGAQGFAEVRVIARTVPGEVVVFDKTFTLPADPVDEWSLTHSGYFYVDWDAAVRPLAVGTEVDFGSEDIPIIGTVADCNLNTPGTDVSSAITYQGSLQDGGKAANGVYDLRFRLFDAQNGGNRVGEVVIVSNQDVVDGLFTTRLNFGQDAFDGQARWLEIDVRDGDSTGSYTTLNPRQALTAAPYALSLEPGALIAGKVENGAILRLLNLVGDGLLIERAYNGVTVGTANNNGLQVEKADQIGVYVGEAGRYGVYARTSNSDGYAAIFGGTTADDGFADGVRGEAYSPDGTGVSGANYDSGEGGVGVSGFTSSEEGYGVTGFQSGYFEGDNDDFYWRSGGLFGGRNGVIGITKENGGYGVFGRNDSSDTGGWAGRFRATSGDGVWISTPNGQTGLSVTGGSKNAVVATEDGARLLYAEEATEVWFSDYGFGQLSDGVAVITIDPIFAQTVDLDEAYHVFLQAYGDADLYVTKRTPTQFEVHLRDGNAAVEFSYRLVGKRLGYENDRLERAPFADSDPHLFPEGPVNGALSSQEQGR